MTDSKKCVFEDILKCSEGGEDKLFSDKPLTEKRKSTIINSSKERADNFDNFNIVINHILREEIQSLDL